MDWSGWIIVIVFIRLSDGTHSHPLLRHWCNDAFLQIWWRNKLNKLISDGQNLRLIKNESKKDWFLHSNRLQEHNAHPWCTRLKWAEAALMNLWFLYSGQLPSDSRAPEGLGEQSFICQQSSLSQPLKALHLNRRISINRLNWESDERGPNASPRGPKHDCSLSSECWWKRLETWNEDFSETAFSVIIYIIQNF